MRDSPGAIISSHEKAHSAAGWRFTPPPRALATVQAAEVHAVPIMEHLIDGSTMAMVTIDPGTLPFRDTGLSSKML